ncbi:sulfotransferase domain-containing protein [Candidatus Pelagibacter communis]|uniref:sulfotransferase domain-containing protein n=1 Tax=Pelagibacter ubique TaxID=198252 RepID=UPI00094D9BC1|nr:sulfotransferase domain-containing protein [Candidatus Pelagibacter ubique]
MIIWLASYPKSGNTWLRSLLASYYFSKRGEFDFTLLNNIDQFPSVNFFKNDKDFYLRPEDTSAKWIEKQKLINSDNKLKFFKTHNALCKINGNGFTDEKNTLGAIYIIRDPRNIVSSLAHHYEIKKEEALRFMDDEKKALIEKKENRFLGFVTLFSWKFHVDSWNNCSLFPVLTIKYEDLESSTYAILKKVIEFITKISKSKTSFNRQKAKIAVESCNFEKLKNLEKKNGFNEAMIKKDKSGRVKFFNLGGENNYKKILNPNLTKQINTNYREYLEKFNYEI